MARKMHAYGECKQHGRYALYDYCFPRNHAEALTIRRVRRSLKKRARQRKRHMERERRTNAVRKLTDQEAIENGMDDVAIAMGILDGEIISDTNKLTSNEKLHGKIVGTRMDPYHDVTIYEDGYEERYYIGGGKKDER